MLQTLSRLRVFHHGFLVRDKAIALGGPVEIVALGRVMGQAKELGPHSLLKFDIFVRLRPHSLYGGHVFGEVLVVLVEPCAPPRGACVSENGHGAPSVDIRRHRDAGDFQDRPPPKRPAIWGDFPSLRGAARRGNIGRQLMEQQDNRSGRLFITCPLPPAPTAGDNRFTL
jgi:hypothetical protein